MSLVKNCKKEASLNGIVGEDGDVFNNNAEQEEYICKTFENLYKKPDENILTEDCIKNFLGDVYNADTVAEAKLNANEKIQLEAPLSIEELDESAKNAKTKSAPGADGFSNKFIQKFWKYFRHPLF